MDAVVGFRAATAGWCAYVPMKQTELPPRGDALAVTTAHPPSPKCRHAGFTLDLPALQALVTKFDPDSSGTLTLDEFIRTCLMLQTAARVFGAFDQRKTGNVTFSFSQFVSGCGHVAAL